MKKRFWYALALLSGVTCSGIASAQQPGYGDSDLRARLDRLEQQNAELRQTMAQRLPPVDQDENGSGEQFTSFNAMAPEDDKLNAAIGKYMKDQEAKKKKEADDKKAAGYEVGSDNSLLGKWNNDGATFQSPNADFKYHTRGLAQLDYINMQNTPGGGGTYGAPGVAANSSGNSAGNDSVDFRRLRLGGEGTMYEWIDFVWEFDFAFFMQNFDPASRGAPVTSLSNGNGATSNNVAAQSGNLGSIPQPTTIFATFKDVPILGNIRVGNQQDWLSQEHIESARFTDFMERAVIMDAFAGPNNNGYAPGISAFNNTENKRMGLQIGMYKTTYYDGDYTYNFGEHNYTYNARIIGTPYYDEESHGRYLLHLGFGTEYRQFNTAVGSGASNFFGYQNGQNVRIRVRGDVRNGVNTVDPNFADTGNFYANDQALINPEFAFQWGSLLIQGEWMGSQFGGAALQKGSGTTYKNAFMQGGYVSAMYFLTGENRVYNRQTGVFGRVIPNENAYVVRGARPFGRGAWQVGARYDWVDLNSAGLQGGQNQNLTLGLNWFLNPNMRFQFNYVASYWDNSGLANNGFGAPAAPAGRVNGNNGYTNMIGARWDMTF